MLSNKQEQQPFSEKVQGALIKGFFVIISSMLVFESVRNSLTWYLIQFWGGAGDMWQELWDRFLGITGKFASPSCYEYVFVGLVKSQNVLKDIKRFLKRSQNILKSLDMF